MKALTLTQPWATLVVIGAKRIETRSWSTSYRGPLAIHAAKSFPGSAKDLCTSRGLCRALGWPQCPNPLTQEWLDDNAQRIKSLPLGAVIGSARLVHCIETDLISRFVFPFTEQEKNLGNYDPGRFGFLLEEAVAYADAIPARGALGLWEWK